MLKLNSGGECLTENWHWNQYDKSPEVLLSNDLEEAYFHCDPIKESTGTAGVRGNKGFSYGEHYWEIEFLEPPYGTSVMIGVGTKKALLHVGNYRFINLIGMDEESWGLSHKGLIWHGGRCHHYCEPIYDHSIVGCHLNLYEGTLSFYLNGQSLGVAFRGLWGKTLYPMTCSTASETELALGIRRSRYMTLEDSCLSTISTSLSSSPKSSWDDAVEQLPLPGTLKARLRCVD